MRMVSTSRHLAYVVIADTRVPSGNSFLKGAVGTAEDFGMWFVQLLLLGAIQPFDPDWCWPWPDGDSLS